MVKELKDLYKQLGLTDDQLNKKTGMPKSNEKWKGDLLKPLSIKQYGRSYDDKLKNMFGGNEWKSKDFERYMNYKDVRDTMNKSTASRATSSWEKSHEASLKKQAEEEKKRREKAEKQKKEQQRKKAAQEALNKSFGGNKKKSELNLLDDLKAAGTAAYHGFNPFDDISMKDAVKGYTERNTSKAFDEIARGSNRTVDSASLGAMSNLDKRVNDRQPYYNSQRKFGEGGGTDMLTTGLGYLVPGVGAYKALNATKLGTGLTQFGSKGIGQRLASEAAKGGLIGAGMSMAEVGARESLNPDDYNWKQNLGYIGMNTAIGAAADPALYGLGKGIGKGFETAANRTMRNLLPDGQQVGRAVGNVLKGDTALPVQGGIPKPNMQDLLPRVDDLTNPNFAPSLVPKPKPQVEAPKVNTRPLDEILANPRPDVPETPIQQPTLVTAQETPQPAPTQQAIPRQGETVSPQETVPQQPLQRPENLPYVEGERKAYNTIANSEKASNEFIDGVKNLDRKYTKISDKEAVDFANGLIKRDVEEAFQFVKNATIRDKRHNTVGLRLIDELQTRGDFERAVDMIDILAKEGTKHGQGLQSFTLYNRLTAEGQLIRLQRIVNKKNELAGVNGPKIELTDDMQKTVVAAADSIQKLTGQAEAGKNVIDIVERMKKGQMATDEETEIIKSFFEDAKKFISDLDPKAKPEKVKPIKGTRNRDKVVAFMDQQEQASKEALKQIFRRANSMPVDALYHMGVIGASKIAKGTVKLADFSEIMVKELGEDVRPFMQQIYNKSVELFNKQSSKMTGQRLTTAEKVVNKALKEKNLDEATAKEINRLLRQVVEATEGSKFEANMELQMVLNALERPTFGQKVSSFQTIMQLFNAKTMERNIIGNESFYRTERATRLLLAAPFDKVRVTIFGGKRRIVFNSGQFLSFSDYFQPMKDYWRGLKMGAKAGWKGVNPYGLQSQYEIRSLAFTSKYNPMHWFEKALGATLKGFDTAGYMRAYKQQMRELGTLRAMEEGLKGKQLRETAVRYALDLDENMTRLAEEYGKYATFQDDTALSKILQQIKQWMNLNFKPEHNKGFGFGDLVLKYAKTPANLIMRAMDYSPAGFIRSAGHLRQFYKYRNPEAIEGFEMALSRAIMGTVGFSGFGYVLADKGVLTTKGSNDYEVNALQKQAGIQPNSVNWTAIQRFLTSFDSKQLAVQKGDTFISIDWLQPLAISLAIGAGVNQSIKELGELDVFSAAKAATSGAVDTVLNMSVLSGLKNFVQTVPGEDQTERFARVSEGLGSSFVPTFLNQTRQFSDNTARETYSPDFLGSFTNKAINRIPVLEKKLPASYETLGQPKEVFQGGSNNVGNVFFNPAFVSKYNPSEVEQFLLDYISETGDTTVVPRLPKKSLDGVPLTGKQRQEWQRIMGQETNKELKNLLPELKANNNKEEVGKEIYDLLNAAGKKARGKIRKGLVSQEQLKQAREEYGIDEETVYERLSKGWTLNRALTTPY